MHPEEIKPEDTKSADLNKTAISLTMYDPEDKDSIISFSIPLAWFFEGDATKHNKESVPFGDYANVEIIYKNRTLLIEADGAINVSIESGIPTHALIVKTAGDCNINAMIGLHDSITIEAKDIAFNADTASDRLTLLCNKDTLNSIKINAEVITNSLNATANELIIAAKLDAKTRILYCNKISIEQTGAFTPIGFPNPRYEVENSNKLAYVAPVDTESRINIDFLENRGHFESNHGIIIVKNSIALLEHSVAKFSDDKLIFARISFDSSGSFEASDSHLIWVKAKGKNRSQLAFDGAVKLTRTVVQHPNVIFNTDCEAHLSKTKITSKRHILLNAKPIKGDNVELCSTDRLYTKGDCDINNLAINTNTAKIRSVLDGNDFMSFKADGKAEVHGLIHGKNTIYQGNFLLLTPITKDWSMLHQMPYKFCRKKGGLVGAESLSLNTLVLVRIAGGYISAPTLNGMTGVDINIGGLSYAYNYNFQRGFAPIELGFDLPWLPNGMHDLVSINKILALSYRMILTVGKAEYAGIASALTLAGAAGPTVVRGIRSIGSSIYEDPNPLNHLKYTRDVGIALKEKIARRIKELAAMGYNTFSSRDGMATGVHDMQKSITGFYNSTKLLDLVNVMLNAKGMYIAGNSIMYHATNVVKFTTDVQQWTLPPLTLQQVALNLDAIWRDYVAMPNSENQGSTYNWELFNFLGKELYMFLGPSVYKSTLTVAVDFNYIVSGTVVQEAAILVESTNVYAINSASSALIYFNRGNYHGSYRVESAIYRYDNGEYHTQSLQVNARHNTVYGKFKPPGKLVFNVTSNHVAPGAEFILPADTRGLVTGDFINEGKVLISGREFIIKGKFHVKATGIANINNAYFQKDKLIVEGKYTALNSILSEADQRIATDAEYSIINSERHGDSVTWEKGAKVNVDGSYMYGSNFEDLGASVTTNGNARFKMTCIFRDGHWQVSDVLIFDGENVQTTLQSTLNGTETSHVEVHADHADLQGSENVQSSVVNVKNMSASEISEYVNNTGKHANKTIHKQLVMQTERNESIEINSFGRDDVGVAILTPGAITQNAPYHGRSLDLHSTEDSVHLNKDVATELDINIFAKKHIFKPGVVVESFKGNVQLVAEKGTLDNDNGGQILAHTGNTTAIGALFSNNTNGASRMSSVYGDNVVAGSTQGAFDVFRGLLKAKTVLEIYAAADFNIQPEVIREWLSQHEMGNVYYGSVLQGGTGTPENGGVGLILRVGGKFNGVASSINSIGKNLIFVNKDIHGETKITVYKSEDYPERHGFFRNKHYFTEQAAKEFRMEILSEDQNIIHSLEGKVQLEGVQTFAPNGTETFSSQEMIARAVPYTLRNTHNTNRHVYESKHSSKSEQEAMTVYAHTTGVTSFTSGKFIYHNGVLYYGLPGSEFKFIAPEGITLTSNILNNRATSTSVSAQLAICGQTLIGSDRQLNPMNTVSHLDPTGGSLADFAHSSNIVEALVNCVSSIYGISNMFGSIVQNGLMNTLASQMGASLILSLTKTAFDYQTEGAGGFYGGANIRMQTNGIATFAVNAYGKVAIFEVTADELRILNTILKSKFTSESISIAPSINLDGSYDLSASYAHQSSSSIAQIQRNLSIGIFNLNVRYLHNRGANIVCNKINGKVDTIENENTVNTTTSTQTQVSASIQGNVSGNHVHATEETEGAKASILVTDGVNTDPEYNFEVNTLINHGDAKMSALDPDTEVVHVDQTLKSTRVGGGFSHNFSKKANKPVTKLSVDLLNQISTINEDGLTVTQRSKFKATVPVPKFTAPKTQPKEESFINLGESNASSALSGRRPSIIGDALRQLESNDFLVDPGYEYGRPSSAAAVDTEVNESHHTSDLGQNSEDRTSRELQKWQYTNPPVTLNEQLEPQHLPSQQGDNKSFSRKMLDFYVDVSRDADESSTDFWDVPSNPVLTAGRAAITRGLANGAVASVQPLIHPVDTVAGLTVLLWDSLNVISDANFGVATDASRQRWNDRGAAIVEGIGYFKDADPIQRLELGSKFAGTMLFSSVLGGAAQGAVLNAPRIGANILKPLTFARQMPRPKPISLELNNRMLTLKSEFASLSNIYDYGQLQKPILPLFRPLDYKGEPLKNGLRIYQEGRPIVSLNPYAILPSQKNVPFKIVTDYSKRMKHSGWGDFTPLDIVRLEDGRLFTFDHRRFAAAIDAGIDVHAVIYEYFEKLPNEFAYARGLYNRKFDMAQSWGDAIDFRINKQSKECAELLRQGKWELKYRE